MTDGVFGGVRQFLNKDVALSDLLGTGWLVFTMMLAGAVCGMYYMFGTPDPWQYAIALAVTLAVAYPGTASALALAERRRSTARRRDTADPKLATE
jgi:hypothetical protein